MEKEKIEMQTNVDMKNAKDIIIGMYEKVTEQIIVDSILDNLISSNSF